MQGSSGRAGETCCQVNVGQMERLASVIAGGTILMTMGGFRSLRGVAATAIGSGLICAASAAIAASINAWESTPPSRKTRSSSNGWKPERPGPRRRRIQGNQGLGLWERCAAMARVTVLSFMVVWRLPSADRLAHWGCQATFRRRSIRVTRSKRIVRVRRRRTSASIGFDRRLLIA